MHLNDCRITNAVKCVPPGNAPTTTEIARCNLYLRAELDSLWQPRVRRARCVLTLGGVAHRAVCKALAVKPRELPFAHGRCREIAPRLHVLASYHPSRLNVATKRIDYAMLHEVVGKARHLLDD
jgi:uracil-DNA glycosylase family 4